MAQKTKKEIKKPKTKKTKIQPAQAEELKLTKGPRKSTPEHIIINKAKSALSRWYVVHTYSGHEHKVAQQLKQRVESMGLEDKILELLIPVQEKIEIRSGKKKKIKEKIFPGYLLVKMILTDQSWLTVRTTNGITGFVGVGNKPTPIEAGEVKTIQKFMTMEAPKFKAKFTLDEAVKIIDGPFADFLGSVNEIDEAKGKVKVLVSIFGRETPVELDFLQISKI
ncbi:MAG: transcription termination/antitermination protein NusG [Candidatus Marinimicrobia bacterium]|nr:transcription termination/antitermination protein NusG [Candidatus Neomarinimicrobiota bacterium]